MSIETGQANPQGAEFDAAAVQQAAVEAAHHIALQQQSDAKQSEDLGVRQAARDASREAQEQRDQAVMQTDILGSMPARKAVGELRSDALDASLSAIAETRTKKGTVVKGIRVEHGSITQAEKRPDGMLDVRQTSTVNPDRVGDDELLGNSYFDGRHEATTTESVAPAKGLGIRGVPDMSRKEVRRVSGVKTSDDSLPRTGSDSEKIPHGDDVVFSEEFITPTGRTVKRKTTVGYGAGDVSSPILETIQETTDQHGKVVRSNKWASTPGKPSDVAVRVARAVGGRTTKAQPGKMPPKGDSLL